MRNGLAVVLALIGGFLLFQVSWIGSIGFIADIATYAALYFPAVAEIITLVLTILLYIASLGGIAVIIGGILIARERVGTGKVVIGLGAGVGLFGLIITLVEAYLTGGLAALTDFLTLISQSIAWIGVIMSIVARSMAKKE
ncbi:MAG: hypothetical protein KGD60_11740 [Candidatus Thorarchaeota archaeon]|nr:hypothetical protein [Candidatus Thorarchaeota archaeon]